MQYKGLDVLEKLPDLFETEINGELVIGYKKEFKHGDYLIYIIKTAINNVYHMKRYAIKNEN